MATLTEKELKDALDALNAFKNTGLTAERFDPTLPSGQTISFTKSKETKEWTLK